VPKFFQLEWDNVHLCERCAVGHAARVDHARDVGIGRDG